MADSDVASPDFPFTITIPSSPLPIAIAVSHSKIMRDEINILRENGIQALRALELGGWAAVSQALF